MSITIKIKESLFKLNKKKVSKINLTAQVLMAKKMESN